MAQVTFPSQQATQVLTGRLEPVSHLAWVRNISNGGHEFAGISPLYFDQMVTVVTTADTFVKVQFI